MKVVQEVTDWEWPNHTYLLDGSLLLAYIKQGTSEPIWFKTPLRRFSTSGRKFKELKTNPFGELKIKPVTIRVAGSKGNFYEVNPEARTCTCPGFQFRGACKHLSEIE